MKKRKNTTFEFDAEIYSEQAVKSAIYDLDMVADISIIGDSERTIKVELKSKKDNHYSLEVKIYNAILDHQIRLDIEKETAPIRKLIIAQAFFPCENLYELLEGLEL